jgi:hypothetical protein
MIQAYDFRRDNGGPMVLAALLKTDVSSVLLLRLMEGINVSSDLRRRTLERIVQQGFVDVKRTLESDELELLFNLNAQAREQFIQLFLLPDVVNLQATAARPFCSTWAGKVLHGSAGRLSAVWNPPILAAARALLDPGGWEPDAATANWLVTEGVDPHYSWSGWDGIMLTTFNGTLGGFVWRCMEDRFVYSRELPDDPIKLQAIEEMHQKLQGGSLVPELLVDHFSLFLPFQGAKPPSRSRRYSRLPPWRFPSDPEALDQTLKELLIWTVCAMRESKPRSEYLGGPIENVATGFWEGDFEPAVKLRSISLASRREKAQDPELSLEDDELAMVKRFIGSIPSWLREWFYGRRSFVRVGDRY